MSSKEEIVLQDTKKNFFILVFQILRFVVVFENFTEINVIFNICIIVKTVIVDITQNRKKILLMLRAPIHLLNDARALT